MQIHIRPAAGCLVRDPKTRERLPESGALVQDSSFWRRRLADGSVEMVRESAAKAKPKEPKA